MCRVCMRMVAVTSEHSAGIGFGERSMSGQRGPSASLSQGRGHALKLDCSGRVSRTPNHCG